MADQVTFRSPEDFRRMERAIRRLEGQSDDTTDVPLYIPPGAPPVHVRVTSNPSGGLYPSVFVFYNPDTGSWYDDVACKAIGPNGETLTIGTRYLGRVAGTKDGFAIVIATPSGTGGGGSGVTGYFVRLTSTNGIGGWNYVKLTHNGTAYVDNGTEVTGFTAKALTIDGSFTANPQPGVRVWMLEGLTSGVREFLPIWYAWTRGSSSVNPALDGVLAPGLVSTSNQPIGGETFVIKGFQRMWLSYGVSNYFNPGVPPHVEDWSGAVNPGAWLQVGKGTPIDTSSGAGFGAVITSEGKIAGQIVEAVYSTVPFVGQPQIGPAFANIGRQQFNQFTPFGPGLKMYNNTRTALVYFLSESNLFFDSTVGGTGELLLCSTIQLDPGAGHVGGTSSVHAPSGYAAKGWIGLDGTITAGGIVNEFLGGIWVKRSTDTSPPPPSPPPPSDTLIGTTADDVPTNGTSPTDIFDFPIPGGTISDDGGMVSGELRGTVLGSLDSTGRWVLTMGTTVFDTGDISIVSSGGGWELKFTIFRTGETTARTSIVFNPLGFSAGTRVAHTDVSTGIDWDDPIDLTLTATAGGTGATDDDIVLKTGYVRASQIP